MVSILIDEDILLRSYGAEDAPLLFRAVNDNRVHLRKWLDWVDGTMKVEHSLEFIQQCIEKQNQQEGITLGIFSGRKIIGAIGMHNWNHKIKKAEIGYWVDKEHQGTGILSKCLGRFVDFLFQDVNLNKIEIHFMPGNTRSARVAERLGCKVEGIIRQSIFHNGRMEDRVITGLLRDEWVKQT